MAKQRSEEPDSNPMDNISIEDTPQAQDYVEVKRGGAKPSRKVKPAIIPGGAFSEQMLNAGIVPTVETYTSPLTSKETKFMPATDAAVRTYNYKDVKAPIIAGVDKSKVMPCDASKCDIPATHSILLPNAPRKAVAAACPEHLNEFKSNVAGSGLKYEVKNLKTSDIAAIKTLRRNQEQHLLAGADIYIHTLNTMLPEEDKIVGKYTFKQPKEKPAALGPSMSTPSDPDWNPEGYAKIDRSKDPNYYQKKYIADTGRPVTDYVRKYDFPKRATKVAMGTVESKKESPEFSSEELSKLDPATRAYIKGRRAREIPSEGLRVEKDPERKGGLIGTRSMNFTFPLTITGDPDATVPWTERDPQMAALEKISEEHAPHVLAEIEMTKQASKQRRIEMAKRNPSFRVGLEMDARKALQNKPKELE